MVRIPRPRLIRDLPVTGGIAAALAAALFFLMLPDWRLEGAVSASGLPRLLPFAEPPLGWTARLLLAGGAATLAGAIAWSALFLVWGPGGWLYRAAEGDAPAVRRADAHPDAPPRRPLSAAELGVPPPPAERPIPKDLDQPLAEFHPAAIPEVPLEPVRPVAPLARVAEPEAEPEPEPEPVGVPQPEMTPVVAPQPETEPEMTRMETFALKPVVDSGPRPPRPPRSEQTVEALLERLERAAQSRTAA